MKTDNFFKTEHFYHLLMEIVIALIHPNKLTDNINFVTPQSWYLLEVPYEMNDYLTVFIMIRVYTLLRSLVISTEYYTIRAYRVTKMFGGDLSTMFCFKCYFTEHPFRFLLVYTVSVTTLMAYIMRIIEGPVYYLDATSRLMYNDFRIYENCVWNTFVTMSTGKIFN